ncbi:hypothetical protein L228DRAFT_249822 [Xylona heveae TC161]|uniref:LCCL domain-containing protein n=1 Tax=Xylona heveae (strain CBS 132557 / TC161) TaxID=1328760 RepID=A0A165A9W1_XYLHT|nr:hypothetical protein L228DRAFT_249822 [Xylona heveae TC161]KZF20146.1 hypothetical protein L228DRAFT_249822 [Xylona heveae TC161]
MARNDVVEDDSDVAVEPYRDQSPGDDAEDPSAQSSAARIHVRSQAMDGDDSLTPTRSHDEFLLPSRRWRWIPVPVERVARAVGDWVRGPHPPHIQKINPFLPRLQEAPVNIINRCFPKRSQKTWLLVVFYLCWIITFIAILHKSAFAGDVRGYGTPSSISCTASFWSNNNGCGLNGNDCRPFDNATFAFRCPAGCSRTMVLNPRAVGAQEVNYRPFVIGGGLPNDHRDVNPVYRGDSFICGSAIHAGVISNKAGGCAALGLVGERDDYPGTKSHGISSIPFDTTFPLSYSFIPDTASQCKDLRWPLLAVSVTFTTILSLCTSSPSVFFSSVFVGLFFHVGLGSDPPSLTDYYSIVSVVLGRFLPAAFVAFAIYRYCVRRQLTGLTAHVEKTVLWLGGCWVGALNNYTFDHIPIQRLTGHDLNQQPGAKVALVIIVVALLVIALGQVWFLRLEGRLPRYLVIYVIFAITLALFVAIPGLNLRIHHYILALLLLPGTAMQTRPALLYQGILVGLFINGIARWGFDSILQTPAALLGDAQLGSKLPNITAVGAPLVGLDNITFTWPTPPYPYDGMSVLVNDVERYRGYIAEGPNTFTWEKANDHLDNGNGDDDSDNRTATSRPTYFRFGYMRGSSSADYTKAGTWQPDGSWTEMHSGPSR